jgi:uncharacterized oxidoreductase
MKTFRQHDAHNGGTSGIGYELARRLAALGNTVILTGRSQTKLAGRAQEAVSGVHSIQSDVSDPTASVKLYRQVVEEFPCLNVLINNAGTCER